MRRLLCCSHQDNPPVGLDQHLGDTIVAGAEIDQHEPGAAERRVGAAIRADANDDHVGFGVGHEGVPGHHEVARRVQRGAYWATLRSRQRKLEPSKGAIAEIEPAIGQQPGHDDPADAVRGKAGDRDCDDEDPPVRLDDHRRRVEPVGARDTHRQPTIAAECRVQRTAAIEPRDEQAQQPGVLRAADDEQLAVRLPAQCPGQHRLAGQFDDAGPVSAESRIQLPVRQGPRHHHAAERSAGKQHDGLAVRLHQRIRDPTLDGGQGNAACAERRVERRGRAGWRHRDREIARRCGADNCVGGEGG